MSLAADRLLDRSKLKSEIMKWRSLTIVIATLLAASVLVKSFDNTKSHHDYIAYVKIDGIILEDESKDEKLEAIINDKHAKALVVYINSPGGTMVGGESLYKTLREISKVKPVVAYMGSVAASGGYMAAIAADRIYAMEGTITGSVGVLLQSAEVSELSKKVGVNFITFKSGQLKAVPSPLEKITPEAAAMVNETIKDSFETFIGMVKARRPLTEANIANISSGRIFTGKQAVKNKLIDAIGGKKEAVEWLYAEKKLDRKLTLEEINLEDDKEWFGKFYTKIMGGSSYITGSSGRGIMALWNPALMY